MASEEMYSSIDSRWLLFKLAGYDGNQTYRSHFALLMCIRTTISCLFSGAYIR